MIRNLSICLHNVVGAKNDIQTIYDITESQLLQLNEYISSRVGEKYDAYTLYFDDGYESFNKIVSKLNLGIDKGNIRCAVIVEQIGLPNKLSSEEIQELSRQGYGIDSHSMSHAALAVFQKNVLQITPAAGTYQSSPYGSNKQLTEQQVLFQLIESKIGLEKIVGHTIDNFVLPYGLYNRETIQLITSRTSYRKILTCHTGIDIGQVLSPRLLITQENIDDIAHILDEISNNYKLLTELQ